MTDAGPNGKAPDATRAPLTGDDAHPNTIVITSFATLMEARAWPAFSLLLDPNVVYEIPREEPGAKRGGARAATHPAMLRPRMPPFRQQGVANPASLPGGRLAARASTPFDTRLLRPESGSAAAIGTCSSTPSSRATGT